MADYVPGDAYYGAFTTQNPTTGAATAADSLPTATLMRNGADDGAVTLTCASVATGRYKVTGTIPSTYVSGDVIQIAVAATVNSVAGLLIIDSFVLDKRRLGDTLIAYTGTASAGGASTITLAGAVATDSFYNGLTVKIVSGTGAGQGRIITGYVGATKVATVDRAWATNPDNTSVFVVLANISPKLDASLRVDLGLWVGTAPAAVTASGYIQTTVLRWLTDNAAGTPVALSTNGLLQAMVMRWLTDNAAGTPAALSATNGYLQTMTRRWLTDDAAGTPAALSASGYIQSMLRRWLTDDVGGTPSALNSGLVQTDVERWVNQAPLALSTNGYVQTMVMRWLTDNAGGTPNALSSGTLPADVKLWLATAPLALSSQQVQVVVAAYAAGKDPATLLLTTPANLIGTDASGRTTDINSVAIKAKTDLIPAAGPASAADWTSTRAGYVDNLNIGGLAASAAAVANIQNNTFVSSNIPTLLEKPDAGSVTVPVTILFCDETGAAKDIDAAANPTILLVNDAGTDLTARLSAIAHPATGKYTLTYTNSAADALETLHWEITATLNAKLRRYVVSMQVLDTTAASFTSTDRTNLGAIKAKTDALLFDGSSNVKSTPQTNVTVGTNNDKTGYALAVTPPTAVQVRQEIDSNSTQLAAIAAKTTNLPASPAASGDPMTLTAGERVSVAAAIWNALTSGFLVVGSAGKLLLDNLNAAITSRMATFTYTAPDNAGIAEVAADADTLLTNVAAVKTDTGNLLTNVAAVKADTAALVTAVAEVEGETDAIQAAIEAIQGVGWTTQTLVAIKAAIDSIQGAAGPGARQITFTVTAASVPVGNILLSVQGAGGVEVEWGYTSLSTGQVILTLVDGSYTVLVSAGPGYAPVTPAALVVTANAAVAVHLTAVSPSPPPAAGLCTVGCYVILPDAELADGSRVEAALIGRNHAANSSLVTLQKTSVVIASGYGELTLIRLDQFTRGGGVYHFRVYDPLGSLLADFRSSVPNASSALLKDLMPE